MIRGLGQVPYRVREHVLDGGGAGHGGGERAPGRRAVGGCEMRSCGCRGDENEDRNSGWPFASSGYLLEVRNVIRKFHAMDSGTLTGSAPIP